ncbi:MAG: alpha/beta fold hydrolase [Cyanobacteriota bacterium]|nr:alpha/beta fold hydrolase [Cyanobacteriota bacterium]
MTRVQKSLIRKLCMTGSLIFSAFVGESFYASTIAKTANLSPAVTSINCPVNVSDLGSVSCGKLTVPENWDQPNSSRSIQLTYIILHGTGNAVAPDPIIWLEGGPGNSPVYETHKWAKLISNLREDRDIILFAQRGTGFAEPLDCMAPTALEALEESGDAQKLLSALTTLLGTDQGVDYTSATTPEDYVNLYQSSFRYQLLEECSQFWRNRNVDLSQYNSRRSSQDILALVNALGYKQYNLLGVSYGTRLALGFMRDYPDQGLRSVILDSVKPPNIDMNEFSTGLIAIAGEQLFLDCQANRLCNQAFPNLRQTFLELTQQLEENPLTFERDDGEIVTVDVEKIRGLFTSINKTPELALKLPLIITELSRGESKAYLTHSSGEPPTQHSRVVTQSEFVFNTGRPLADQWLTQAYTAIEQLNAGKDPIETQDDIFIANYLLSILGRYELPRNQNTLINFINLGFFTAQTPPEELKNLTQQLEPDDIDAIFDQLVSEAEPIPNAFGAIAFGMHYAVQCHEEVPFEDLSKAWNYYQGIELKPLRRGFEITASYFAICEEFNAGTASELEKQAVESEIPTLILAGHYDTQTPPQWARVAAESLENSQFVFFPLSGHITLQYSACARNITQEFLNQPDATVNIDCVDDLEPTFLLKK